MSEPKASTAREVALQVCRDVFGPNPRGAREALDYRLRKTELAPRDRAFATELAYGAIKLRRWLDFELEPYVGERAKALPQPIAEILRLGTYQLRAMQGVEAYAAVSQSVGLARKYGHKGTAGLVNAVLRRVSTEPPRDADFDTRASLAELGDRALARAFRRRPDRRDRGRRERTAGDRLVRRLAQHDAGRSAARAGGGGDRRGPECFRGRRARHRRPGAERRARAARRSPLASARRGGGVSGRHPRSATRPVGSSSCAAAGATRRCRSPAARATARRCSPSTTTRTRSRRLGAARPCRHRVGRAGHRRRRRRCARAPTRTSFCSTHRARGWGFWGGSRKRAGARTPAIPSGCRSFSERCCARRPAA